MKFEILDHPAELRLRIYGKTIEELFTNAAEALATIQKKNIALTVRSHDKCYRNLKREKIEVRSIDVNALLVDFLSEILAKSQINKCVYKVSNLTLHDSCLEAELVVYPIDSFDEDIKAVTYQDVDIQLKSTTNSQQSTVKVWQTNLVFDI